MADVVEKLEIAINQDRPFSCIVRFAAVCAGILIPILAFGLGIFLIPEWQSKTFASYVCLLLTPITTWPFWIIIFYSMGCLISVLFKKDGSQSLTVRIGLYLGVLWSFQYIVLLAIGIFGFNNVLFHSNNYAIFYGPSVVLGFGVLLTLLPMFLLYFFRRFSRETGWFGNSCLIMLFLAVVLSGSLLWQCAMLNQVLDIDFPFEVPVYIATLLSLSIIVCLSLLIYAYRKSSRNKVVLAVKSWITNMSFGFKLSISIIPVLGILFVIFGIKSEIISDIIFEVFFGLIFLAIYSTLVPAPFWCFAVYLYFSIYAYRKSGREKLSVVLKQKFALGWLGGYAAAWGLSIISMKIFYSTLPLSKPSHDCYIATAAAKGHRRFVKSEDIVLESGEVIRVNAQLRCLKCGELMLKTAMPKLHRFFRIIYNAVGPVLARCLAWPVLADVAYIMLKPAEWLVCGMLFIMFAMGQRGERNDARRTL